MPHRFEGSLRIEVYSRYTTLAVRYSTSLTSMGFVLELFAFDKNRRLLRRRFGVGEEEWLDEEEEEEVLVDELEERGEEDGYNLSLN